MLVNAAFVAGELKSIIKTNGLTKRIGEKDYVLVEAWQTACRIQNENTFTQIIADMKDETTGDCVIHARAWIENNEGKVIARADGYCSTGEPRWAKQPYYARASMAQTRALGKVIRTRHAWIMVMAGYEPTPAEEMEDIPLVVPEPPRQNPQIPAQEKLRVIKLPPDQSIIHPPEEGPKKADFDAAIPNDNPPAPMDGLRCRFLYYSQPITKGEGTRMGVKVRYDNGTEEWANEWDTKRQPELQKLIIEAKKAGQEGIAVKATFKRKARPDGSGDFVNISSWAVTT